MSRNRNAKSFNKRDVLSMKNIPGKYAYSAVLNNYMNNSVKGGFTEELCFGIGEGLYFEYCNKSSRKLIFGSSERMIENFCDSMGFQVIGICLSDYDSRVIDRIKFTLDNEKTIPVFLRDNTKCKKEGHLFDKRSSYVYSLVKISNENAVELYDPLVDKYCSFLWEDFLAKGNTAPFDDKVCIPILYIIYGSNQVNNMSDVIKMAIRRTAKNMLSSTIGSEGFIGLESFCKDYLAEENSNQAIGFFNELSNFEKATGLLREFYADFLDEAAGIIGMNSLKELAADFRELANDWRMLLQVGKPGTKTSKEDLVKRILDKEKNLCMKALEITG